jgi:hypothetical protein
MKKEIKTRTKRGEGQETMKVVTGLSQGHMFGRRRMALAVTTACLLRPGLADRTLNCC